MFTSSKLTWSKFFGIGLYLTFLCAGCATRTPIASEALTPPELGVAATYNGSVTIVVANGREFNAMHLPKLSNDALATAVRNAIIKSKLFSEILPAKGRYALNLYVVNVSQPYAGNVMTAGVEIAWTLKDKQTDTVVWKESVQTKKTVTNEEVSEPFERLKRATELAARENVKSGLAKIAGLRL